MKVELKDCSNDKLRDMREGIVRYADAISTLIAECEWRDIASAPKNTAVLTYGFGYEVAHYNTLIKAWVACWDHRPITPTHWRPLPPSPPPTPELITGEAGEEIPNGENA